MELALNNSLTKKVEKIERKKEITMYSCGPTVYNHMTLGNLRAYAMSDFLFRTLRYLDYTVKRVINLTDVGHLTDDGDTGEEKLEKASKRERKTVWEVADFFIQSVMRDWDKMNYKQPKVWARATDHIKEMIVMIQSIEKNGYVYETENALYFDVTKLPNYTILSGQRLEDKKTAVRDDVEVDSSKKHPADFVLWFKIKGKYKNHAMKWNSPWGMGFPGWHIECSAMGTKYLGETIDIHTGGIDHIPIHHTNEIAQNYAAYGHHVVKHWFHNEFITIDGGRMGKSQGNAYTLADLETRGYDPLDLRYLYLTSHYRSKQNFTWEALNFAKKTKTKLLRLAEEMTFDFDAKVSPNLEWKDNFITAISNDLNTPQALAVVWNMLGSAISNSEKLATLLDFDEILGLNLSSVLSSRNDKSVIPLKIQDLAKQRKKAKDCGDYALADKIRDEINKEGYTITDTSDGIVISINK